MQRVFVLGDSISIQYGPFLQQFLQGWDYARKSGEEEALKNLDVPTGANGGNSRMCREWLNYAQAQIACDWFVFNCGLHDIKRADEQQPCAVGADEYRENLQACITHITNDIGAKLCWVRTTPIIDELHNANQRSFQRFARDVEQYNGIADAVMTAADLVVDLHAFTNSFGAAAFRDHAHFTEPVCMAQGAFIAGQLQACRA